MTKKQKKATPVGANIYEFETCCGICILGDLYPDRSPGQSCDIILSEEGIKSEVGSGLILASTIATQRAAVKALVEAGFKRMARFKSTGTGSVITLWGKAQSKNRGEGYRPRIGTI